MAVYYETTSDLIHAQEEKKKLRLFCQKSTTSDKCQINAFRFKPADKNFFWL